MFIQVYRSVSKVGNNGSYNNGLISVYVPSNAKKKLMATFPLTLLHIASHKSDISELKETLKEVAQWLSGRVLDWRLETEGPRVRASPASLRYVLEQGTIILA